MGIIYINGIPVYDGYAYYLDRYLSPRERILASKDIEDVNYEDLTDNENEQVD